MFFVGMFSNIIPIIVLSVISLGLYVNGFENVIENNQLSNTYYSFQLEINNNFDTSIELNTNTQKCITEKIEDNSINNNCFELLDFKDPLIMYACHFFINDGTRGSPFA